MSRIMNLREELKSRDSSSRETEDEEISPFLSKGKYKNQTPTPTKGNLYPSPRRGRSFSFSSVDLADIPSLEEVQTGRKPWDRLGLYMKGLPPKSLRDKYMIANALSNEEIEHQAIAASVAIRTDKASLKSRRELHERQRDIAASNMADELKVTRDAIGNLRHSYPEQAMQLEEIVNRIQEKLGRLAMEASNYGAIKQEAKISRSVEVLTTYADNLVQMRNKDKEEMEEIKKAMEKRNIRLTTIDDTKDTDLEMENKIQSDLKQVQHSNWDKLEKKFSLAKLNEGKINGKDQIAKDVLNKINKNLLQRRGSKAKSLESLKIESEAEKDNEVARVVARKVSYFVREVEAFLEDGREMLEELDKTKIIKWSKIGVSAALLFIALVVLILEIL